LGIGVTVSRCRAPSRSTVKTTGVPALVRMASWSCAQPTSVSPATGSPSIARTVSPARSPAAAAGLSAGSAQSGVPSSQTCPASGPDCTIGTWQASARPAVSAPRGTTQSGTRASVVVDSGTPKPTSTTVKNRTARTRLWNGPANMTMTRCHHGLP
jgi:hypothetical protein